MITYDQKKFNTLRVFKKIVRDGPVSRSDIAQSLDLTNASVLSRVNDLTASDYILSAGYEKKANARTTKGRYSNLLDVNTNSCFTIGYSLEKGVLTGALITLKGNILEKLQHTLSEITIEEVVKETRLLLDELLTHSCLNERVIMGSSLAVSVDYFDQLDVKIYNSYNNFDTLQNALRKEISERFEVTSISTAAALYYFNKFYSSRVNLPKYKVTVFDLEENLMLTTVQYIQGQRDLNITEQTIKYCIIRYDYTKENQSENVKKGALRDELIPKNIINEIALDENCNGAGKEVCLNAMKTDTYEGYIQAIGQLVTCKDELTVMYIRRKLRGLAVVLHNAFSIFPTDKIVVSNFVLPDILFPLFREAVIELFGLDFLGKMEFVNDEGFIIRGAAINAFDNCFLPYTFD